MSRTLTIALVLVLVLSGAGFSVWYVVDDDPKSVATTQGTSGGQSSGSAPKKVIKTLSSEDKTDVTVTTVEEVQETAETSPATNAVEESEAPVAEVIESSQPEETQTVAAESSPEKAVEPEETAAKETLPKTKTDEGLSFDVIRVEKSGDTVLAGRAPAGSNVRIMDGTTLLGSIEADNNGQWVYILETPLQPGAHELGLQVNKDDGSKIKSKDVAIVDVPKGEDSVLAVLVPDEDPGATKIIQLPEKVGDTGISDGELALDSVDYDDGGQTVIGGTSQPGQKVVGYLNNEFVGQGVTDDEGRWTVEPEKKVEEGLHQLRIDQVDNEGKVVARVEIPFSRSGKIESLPDERVVTVQPGNSLWRISRAIYGQGARYAVIYDRNQDQIRNPDLIYPGQIFVLPKNN